MSTQFLVLNGDQHGFLGLYAMLDYQYQLNERLDLFGAARWVRNSAEYDSSSICESQPQGGPGTRTGLPAGRPFQQNRAK